MITEPSEFMQQLQAIQDSTSVTYSTLPSDEPRFIINANTRSITIPPEFTFLGIKNDHKAETIYFEIDRYFDAVDLSTHTCVVQFSNSSNSGLYPVTVMDTETVDGKIIFGWEIMNDVTAIVGNINFSVRFYSVDENSQFTYNFNTLPANSVILDTLDVDNPGVVENYPSELEAWLDRMNDLSQNVVKPEDVELLDTKIDTLETSFGELETNVKELELNSNAISGVLEYTEDGRILNLITDCTKVNIVLNGEYTIFGYTDKNITFGNGKLNINGTRICPLYLDASFEQSTIAISANSIIKISVFTDDVIVALIKDIDCFNMDSYMESAINQLKSSVFALEENKAEQSEVDELKSELVNSKKAISDLTDKKITKFYAGNLGETTLNDSDNGKITDMKVYGKGFQQTYSGKNLANDSLSNNKQYVGNYYINDSSSNFSFASNSSYNVFRIDVEPNTTYTLSCLEKTFTSMRFEDTDNNLIQGSMAVYEKKQGTFTTPDECGKIAVCVSSNGDAHIQLEKGETDTDYEPYVGGIPSPNPDYPQEIKSVVNPVVKVCGKNLFKTTLTKAETYGGITYTPNSDGSINIKGTRSGSNGVVIGECKLSKGTYTLYIVNETGSDLLGYFDGVFTNATVRKQVFTVDKNETKKLMLKGEQDGIHYDGNFYVMVLTGNYYSKSVDYEPYKEQTVTLPYTLNAIPVGSGGNVTIDGQQYVSDYVDVERKKLVRMVYGGRMYGTTNGWSWLLRDNKLEYCAVEHPYFNKFKNVLDTIAVSNSFSSGANWGGNSKNKIGVSNSHNAYVFIGASSFDSLDDLTSYLDDNEVYVYSLLETPTETDLTDEEVQAFKALSTYSPYTNVFVTSEQLDGYTEFNYPISMANGWNYVKEQLGDTRDYIYDMDLQSAEAYVNSEYAVALAELEV